VPNKGSAFEREISRYLTKWVTGNDKPYLYWRMPGSGMIATVSEENKELSGDIISLRIEGAFLTDKFSIECKTGYISADFWKTLKNNKNDELKLFWKQALFAGNKTNKSAIIIFRKKGLKPIIGIDPDYFKNMTKIFKLNSVTLTFEEELPRLTFFDMDTFFECVSPEDIKRI